MMPRSSITALDVLHYLLGVITGTEIQYVDILLTFVLSVALSYLLFGRDVRYVGSLNDRQRLTARYVLRAIRTLDPTVMTPLRVPLAIIGLFVGFSLGAAIFNQLSGGMLGAGLCGIIPYLLLRPRRTNMRAQMEKAMPRLLLNLLTVVQETDNLYAAFRQALRQSDGPVFDHVRERLNDVSLGVPLPEILRQLSVEYDYEPFSSMVRVLEQASQHGTAVHQALNDIERHLYAERETQARLSIARRSLILIALGVLGLLPALICTSLFPVLIGLANQH